MQAPGNPSVDFDLKVGVGIFDGYLCRRHHRAVALSWHLSFEDSAGGAMERGVGSGGEGGVKNKLELNNRGIEWVRHL